MRLLLLPLLLLLLPRGLRCGRPRPPPATRGAPTPVPAAPAEAPGHSPPAPPRLPAPGEVATLRPAAPAPALPLPCGHARLGLRPRVALRGGGGGGGGVLSGPAWCARWHGPRVRAPLLRRALRARRAAPTPGDPFSPPRRWPGLAARGHPLGPRERTSPLGLTSPAKEASWAAGGLLRPEDASLGAPTGCPPPEQEEEVSEGHRRRPPAPAVACQQPPCAFKTVQITRDPGLASLVYTRSMDIELNATTVYDCPVQHITQFRWGMYSVAAVNDEPDWSKPLVVPHFQVGYDPRFMFLPRGTLALGVYVLNFTIRLVPRGSLVVGTDQVYLSIVKEFLQAVLLGDANVTVPFADPVVLNGSTSRDPNVADPLDGVQFSWYCSTDPADYNGDQINVISDKVCLPGRQVDLQLTWAADPVLDVAPETLRGGRSYFFRMVIRKAGNSAYADKTVHVLRAPAPAASIACVENCGRILVLSDRFSLSLSCPDCARSRDAYRWSLERASGAEVPFDWPGQTSTGRDGDSLSIKAFAFRNFSEAPFWIVFRLETWGGANLTLRHAFIVNYAPQAGACEIHPPSGVAFVTKFVVRCRGFQDQNLPLTYKMIVSDLYNGFGRISSVTENTLGPILYVGRDPASPETFLPVGAEDRQYSLKVFIQVYDALEAFSQVTSYTTVQAPTSQASPRAILQQLADFSVGPLSDVSDLLGRREFVPAGYSMYLVASVLNSMRPWAALRADKAALLEHLVNQSFLLPTDTLVDINQVVAVIAKATQRTAEFPQVARKPATDCLWQATQALQRGRHLQSEQIEIVGTGILTGVSNILKMTNRHVVYVDPFLDIQSLVETVMAGKVPDNETTVMSSTSFTVYAGKQEKWAVSGHVLGDRRRPCRNCFRPTLNASGVARPLASAPVSTVFCEFADDPFPWLSYQEGLAADVVGFRLTETTAAGDELEVAPDAVDVYIGRRDLDGAAFNLTVGPDLEPGPANESLRKTTGAFRFRVDSRAVRELLVHIVTEVTVEFTVLVYAGERIAPSALVATYLVPHGLPPIAAGQGGGLFDPACAVSVARLVCLPLSLLQVVAQRVRSPECDLVVALKAPHFVLQPSAKLVRISLFGVSCLDMNGIQSDWREGTCVLGEKTTWDRVHCVCGKGGGRRARRGRRQLANVPLHFRYLTAKVIVPPNPVDLRLEVIKGVTHNPVTLFVVLLILFTYTILAFWALHRDETDRFLRDHAIVLLDNDPYDTACYLVTVFTGSRCGSGTRANVFVQLAGTQSSSDLHCLSHPRFKTLYRGSIHTFLLTTRRDLGDVRAVRVWHNNEGRSPGWYLSRIKVENPFTRRIWLFMCREWLSIETSLDRTFPATDPDTALRRWDFLLIDASDKLGKNHMWFSVFAGVIARGFSRLQRLSCCLAMLLSSLLCNIMFFNLERGKRPRNEGSRYVRSMIIGLESVMITIPVQVIITGLFVYSQRKPQAGLDEVAPREQPDLGEESGHWDERLERWHAQETAAEAGAGAPAEAPPPEAGPYRARRPRSRKLRGPRRSLPKRTSKRGPPSLKRRESKAPQPRSTDTNANANANVNANADAEDADVGPQEPSAQPATKRRLTLPQWCRWIAWFLVFATSAVSSFFIVFYGLTYGYDKSIEWLFASFCSFCQSVFLVQPSKIILLTGMRTNRLKYCKNLPWVSNYRYTEVQLPDLRLRPEERSRRHQEVAALRAGRMYQPLTPDELGLFRRKREVKRRALLFLGRLLAHCFLLALLLGLAPPLRRPDGYRYGRFVRGRLSEGLAAVTRLDHVFPWLHRALLPQFHNDHRPTYLPDSSSKILGLPLLRQVRAAPGTPRACGPAGHFPPESVEGEVHCRPAFGADPEDTADHAGAWGRAAAAAAPGAAGRRRGAYKNTKGFAYKPPEERWRYYAYGVLRTYGSGGYAFYFFPDQQQFNSTLRLRELQAGGWLDGRTWAVILELSTLNADAGLLCAAAVLFEVSPLGAVNASAWAHAFALADLGGGASAEVYLYAAVLVFLMTAAVSEGFAFAQEGAAYLEGGRPVLNAALGAALALLLALFLRKHLLAAGIVRLYSARPVEFLPFHAVARADRALGAVLGLLLFALTLKTLGYLRFLYQVRLAGRLLGAALPGLGHAALLAAAYLFLFAALGRLVFGQHEWGYSDVVLAWQTVLSYCAGAGLRGDAGLRGGAAFAGHRALGTLLLAAFVLLLLCVLLRLLAAVLLAAHAALRQPVYEEPSGEVEAVVYLCDKVRTGFGWLSAPPRAPDQREALDGLLYGRPERRSRRYLGLKTRNIGESKMVYLVV